MSKYTLLRGSGEFVAPVAKDSAISMGDLLYYDATNRVVKKVSDYTGGSWSTDEATTRDELNAIFVGVSTHELLADRKHDTNITINNGGVHLFSIESTNANSNGGLLGKYVQLAADSTQDMKNQEVELAADATEAIGIINAVYTGTAITEVEVVFFSRMLAGFGVDISAT